MSATVDRAAQAFRQRFGGPATTVWSAPGRVNLIGEHTDYNDGFVLPFALAVGTAVAARRSDTPEWTVTSEATEQEIRFTKADLTPGAVPDWGAYVAGVAWALGQSGVDVPPAQLTIASDVPAGAGLSSSAALECATLAALLELAAADQPREVWPTIAQRAENEYVGVPCGIMDQSASTLCQPGHALFLDCRSLEVRHVPFDLAASGLAMLVIDTRAPHQHAGGEYAERRATCEAAARQLGLPALRDVSDLAAALSALPDELSRRRVRHVVTENDRTLATVALLEDGRAAEIGPILTASHVSLRDDYEVTVPELDLAVDSALAAGALGARMTGGGFGGCVIALVPADRADSVASAVASAFALRGFEAPVSFVTHAHGGVVRAG